MIVEIETRELSPGLSAVLFTGRLTLGNRLGQVENSLRQCIQQGLRNMVLDLSGLNYIDSAGLGVLAVCVGLMEKAGGTLAIAGATGQVSRLLELTHLDRAVGIYPDLQSAQRALSGPTMPPA